MVHVVITMVARTPKDIVINFAVDVAFESQDEETAAIVNRHLQSR